VNVRPQTLVVMLTSTFLAVACSAPPPPPASLKVVRTLKVGAGDTAVARTYPGDVRARYETSLGFRISGKLVERLVDAGAAVKAGQPLARLDATDSALQASAAEAQRALAAADAKRYRELKDKNFISQAALDIRETALKAAEAQAGLSSNQAAYTTLMADRAGVIAAVSAEVGQVLSVGQSVFRLAPDGEREVAISIPENEIATLTPGMAAEVTFWAGSEQKPVTGNLREMAPSADPVTRTYAARVALPKADARLSLGLSATVRFISDGTRMSGVLVVPLAAIFQQGNQPAVWKVGAGDTVTLHPVTVASVSDAGAVISAGLTEGELIVAAGVHQLTAGEKVRIAAVPAVAK